MAKTGAVWGIDVGNCALKALRCRPHEKETNRIVVEAFEYIEYPKLLTQPEADREELIREALAAFVAENETKGDRVAISVPGQNGLARFIQLPPVEAKKIPDIVKYEARQQIPFALEDVVWDYQPLAGGSQDEGYALETEVGLFAMKRDQVTRALEPLTAAGVEVDFIQLSPLAIYNAIVFDRMGNLEESEGYSAEEPPPSTIVLSFGTDTTDLVITNGFRVWQRNIPIGGSHFTKALTKELQLTFSKAEHLKRNATKAEDPKALFSAMRPVFSDLVSEIQRSIGFFTSKNRKAELGEIVALGNAMKLPGLQRYLSQNLDQKVIVPDEFPGLVGGSVTDAAKFRDNHLTFGDAYGLCVQALDYAQLKTNLLPGEIATARLVKAKKPWTVAAAAVLFIGMMASYGTYYSAWTTADITKPDMDTAMKKSSSVVSMASQFDGENSTLKTQHDELLTMRRNLRSNIDGRLLWLELIRAIDSALPSAERPKPIEEMTAADVANMEQFFIDRVDCEYIPEASTWFSGAGRLYTKPDEPLPDPPAELLEPIQPPAEGIESAEPADPADSSNEGVEPPIDAVAEGDVAPGEDIDPAVEPLGTDAPGAVDPAFDEFGTGDGLAAEGADPGPSGPAWIIQITGYHFHNSDSKDKDNQVERDNEGAEFVRKTILQALEYGSVQLPNSKGETVDVTMDDLGVLYPTLVTRNLPRPVTYFPEADDVDEASQMMRAWEAASGEGADGVGAFGRGNGFAFPGRGTGEFGAGGEEVPTEPPKTWKLRRYDFTIQFLWQPKPRGEREDPNSVAEGDAGGFAQLLPDSAIIAAR